MSFISELERLKEKATKGPLTVDESNWELVAADTDPYKYVANFDALDFSASDLSDEEIKANAKLYVFLRNHADEIAELVKAAESACVAWENDKDFDFINAIRAQRQALANLNKEKS